MLKGSGFVVVCAMAAVGVIAAARQPAPVPTAVVVRPIEPPDNPLPSEAASAGITRFSFFAYGDTRGQADGTELQNAHGLVVDAMLAKAASLADTPFPVRFVIHSGDAVVNGRIGHQFNVSYSPLIEKLTRGAGLAYFSSAGNHDVTGMPISDAGRALGLKNLLAANAKLMPADGSPRRLNGYPTYAFGYGNTFFIALDSNISDDAVQLAWVTAQLEQLDRARYHHLVAFFHHPPFSSGPHGGDRVEPKTVAIRNLYAPLFRRHHVRMTVTGHDHLYDHWVERYSDVNATYRRDDIVTGGGGAPVYTYKSEPDLQAYQMAGSAYNLRVQHIVTPGPLNADNPHHFVVVQVDGDQLSVEVVGIGPTPFAPFGGRSRIVLSDRIS